jgi:translation initiation factor 2 beta subunit (eIF-2beta)/eIF-5
MFKHVITLKVDCHRVSAEKYNANHMKKLDSMCLSVVYEQKRAEDVESVIFETCNNYDQSSSAGQSLIADNESSIANDQFSSTDDDESVAFENDESDYEGQSSSAKHQTTSANVSSIMPANRSIDYGGVIAVRPAVVRPGEFTAILLNYAELVEKFDHDGWFLDVSPLDKFILKRMGAKGTLRARQLFIRRRKLNESKIICVLRHYVRMYKKLIFSSWFFNEANVDKLRRIIRETSLLKNLT